MKKIISKIMKIVMLISMIFSSLQTPLVVLADSTLVQGETGPQKGDIKLGEDGEISNSGSVSMIAGVQTIENDGDVQIVKTVTKVNDDGKYKIEFELKGQDVQTVHQVTKPIYLVIVFDTSGSMICDSSNNSYAYDNWYEAGNNSGTYTAADGTTIYCSNAGRNPNNILSSKWEGAVSGAVNFSDDLTKMANTNVSVVTFASSASSASAWSQTKLNASDFGHPVGSTNLKAGINEARAKLATVTATNAQKYILVVGDGSPTAGGTRNTTATQEAKKAATLAKNEGINIFSIGYGIGNGSSSDSNDDKEAQEVLKYVSSNMTVNASNPTGNETGSYEDKGYYHLASTSSLSASLKTVFEEIGEAAKAGTDAEIVDNIGNKFSVVTTNNTDVTYGGSISESVPEITEDGVKVVFYVQIDREAPTGWYNTNRGFTLTYTDANNQEQTIIYGDEDGEVNPYVYWESYRYQVNYYKDSISENNKLASEVRVVDKDTVINESNVNKDKYLNKAGLGYEYKLVSPLEITVNNPLEIPVINVLYTLKKYTYKVEYYYDSVKTDEINNIGPVVYGTEINPKEYYLDNEDIRLGYKLDTANSDKDIVVINDNDKVIKIYYVKDSFDYTVNYHFGDEETIDNTDTNNTGNAIFGIVINPEDKYLSQDKLVSKGYSDYFLNPNKPHTPNDGLVIGADSSKNIIDIYYITTEVENEKTSKKADKSIISSSSELVQYTVNYQANVRNVQANETLIVTIVDTLPKKINLDKSILNGGVYNEDNKTITWTYEIVVDKYTDNYVIDKTVTYTVNYQDFANMSSSLNNILLNTVKGNVTINSNVSNGSEDKEEVEVFVEGTLTVKHVDELGNDLIASVTTTDKVGASYSETKKDIYGYTNIIEPNNKSGNYIEGSIEVVFVYSKNPGKVTENEVEKTGLENVKGVNQEFNYTLTYNATIEEYVGDVTLTLTDELPYELDTEKSTYDNRCTYENKTLVCTEVVNIDKNNQKVNEEFKLSLVFKGLNVEKVINKVSSKLVYGDKSVEDKDEVETIVLKGTVVVSYIDEAGNELASEEKMTGLAGTKYETSEKSIYGYTLVESPANKNGEYVAEETINVEYVYSKNKGTVVENEVVKTQENSIIGVNSTFKYILTYSGIVKDYVGDATVTLTDKLPYEVLDIKYPNGCTFDEESRELTCQKTVELSENNQKVNVSFEVEVTYNNLVGTTSLSILNKVNSSLVFGNSEINDDSEVEDTIKIGTVIATYKDTLGNVLETEEKTTGLVDTKYETNEKPIYGYTLVETPENKKGQYIDGTITVEYVYSKNPGKVTENEVEKTGLENVKGVNQEFNYTLTYNATIEEYVGDVTLTLTDELPYELDTEKSTYDNRCTYENKTLVCTEVVSIDENNQKVNEEYKLSLVFKELNVEKVINKVSSKLVYGDKSVEDKDEVETIVLKGTVVVSYIDEAGNKLAEDITMIGLAGTKYETSEKSIYGYTLVESPANKNGEYVAEETINVEYVYSKNPGKVTENEVEKTGLENVKGVNQEFNYTLTYNATIEEYVGDVTLTLTDELPYELDTEKSTYDNRCTYENKTLVCTEVVSIDENNQKVNEKFKLSLVFKELNVEKVINKVSSKLVYGDKSVEDKDEVETIVLKGTVVVSYIDEVGNKLAEDITMTGLAETSYETSEKSIYGYTLVESPANKNGEYVAEETINVEYVYSKNKGTVVENEVVKTQENSIIGVNSTFKYILTYSGIVKDYVGDATVTLTDKLPYEVLDIKYPNGCTFDEESRELTCQKTVELSENNQKVNVSFEVEVTYNNLVGTTSLSILNKVNSSLVFGNSEINDDSEVEDTIKIGTVIATYKDTLGNVLETEEKTTGLVDTKYETNEKPIYGYTLVETPENKKGQYIDGTITVEYVYSKNPGKVTENEVEKTGLENVKGVNQEFNYTLTYNATIEEYVGDVTLTLTDELPYELDTEKSTYDNRCTYENKTLVCTEVVSIDENNQKVNEEYKLSLVFKELNVEKVINKVSSKLVYGDKSVEDKDEVETIVLKGTVVVSYIDEAGNKLAEDITMTGLAETSYETNELEFLGYTLIETPENKKGQYIANETINVEYVYSKNVGTSEEELVKTGSEQVLGIDKPFEYTITYNTEIFDYVGDVLVEIKDTPEYEIDIEKSVIGDNCKFDNGNIVCNYKLNVVTEEDGKINIIENLVLYYKNINDSIVNNSVTATLVYGESVKTTDSEWNTEIVSGKVIVSYVDEAGKKLTNDVITSDLAGKEYQTNELVFDGYFLREIQGENNGKYTEGTINVVYVYSKIPLPPQTGVINNFNIYLNLFIGIIGLFIIKRRMY